MSSPHVSGPWLPATCCWIWQQLTRLMPTKCSYLGIYQALDTPKDRAIAIVGVLCAITAGAPLPAIFVIFGKVMSSFPPSEQEITERIGQLLGVAVAYFILTTIYTVSFSIAGERIAVQFRKRLLHSFLHLNQSYLDTHDIEINALLSEKIDTIQVGCSEKVGIFIQSISYFIAAFIVGFILNAKLTGILLAAVIPVIGFIVLLGSSLIKKFASRAAECKERAISVVESSLRAIKTVQAYDMISLMCTKQEKYLHLWAGHDIRKAIAAAVQMGGVYFTAYAANALAFYVGSRMTGSGASDGSSGTIYSVLIVILDASFVLGQFAPFLETFAKATAAYGEIQELVTVCDTTETQRSANRIYDYGLRAQDIVFDEVSFAYPARSTVAVLDGFNLTVRPGSFTAIVGSSGGGKSTVASLLLGIYEYAGKISIGPHELRGLDDSVIRFQISLLDQDCVLFPGTILENICHGLVGKDLSQNDQVLRCEAAAKTAAIDFLSDLPFGIHTQIDNTLQLSGGQRQRICLARALVKDPAILVLDEPTSALDAKGEQKVMRGVRNAASGGTTVIMIAHRLSTVLDADQVVVIENGRVIEQGCPRELSTGDTTFKGLLEAQSTNLDNRNEDSGSGRKEHEQEDVDEYSAHDMDAGSSSHSTPSPGHLRLRHLLVRLYQLSKPEHLAIFLGLFGSVISGGIILGEATILGRLVQLLNTGKDDPAFLRRASFDCLLFLALACIAFASYVTSGSAFGWVSARLTERIQGLLLRTILKLDIAWFSGSSRSAHELTSSFAKNAGDLSSLSGVALGTIFTVLASVIGGIILAHVVAWKIAIVILPAVPVMLMAGYTRFRMLARSENRHRSAYAHATGLVVESCRKRKTVTALGIESVIESDYHKALDKSLKGSFTFAFGCNSLLALSLAISYFLYALAFWWGARLVRDGSYSQKDFFTVLPALLFSAQASGQLFGLSPEIARARTAAANVFNLLDQHGDIIQPEDNLESDDSSQLNLEFVDVTFAYSGRSKGNVLQNVSFAVKSGQMLALVGPSGAGKSSTISLMERFYDPLEGTVLFEGIDVRTTDVRRLRDRISLVPQEPELFPGTIRENIMLGHTSKQMIGQEEVEHVSKQCGLHEFIVSLPAGYDTDCGSISSSLLSGGQRQRLALARALIRDPELLLLDEPTSALDAHSEQQVQTALYEASKGRTTIMVAHRLASIQRADQILVFDHGRVVERGTHTDLVELGGLYASMARAQALV